MQSTLEKISPLESRYILTMRVDATSYEDATQRILAWTEKKREQMCLCLQCSYDNGNL